MTYHRVVVVKWISTHSYLSVCFVFLVYISTSMLLKIGCQLKFVRGVQETLTFLQVYELNIRLTHAHTNTGTHKRRHTQTQAHRNTSTHKSRQTQTQTHTKTRTFTIGMSNAHTFHKHIEFRIRICKRKKTKNYAVATHTFFLCAYFFNFFLLCVIWRTTILQWNSYQMAQSWPGLSGFSCLSYI